MKKVTKPERSAGIWNYLLALYFLDLWLLKFTRRSIRSNPRESFLMLLDLAREFIECTDPIIHVCFRNFRRLQVDFSTYVEQWASLHKASRSRRWCKTVFLLSIFSIFLRTCIFKDPYVKCWKVCHFIYSSSLRVS